MYIYTCIYISKFLHPVYIYAYLYLYFYILLISELKCNLNLESQSHWSLFNRTWQKRPREQDERLRLMK